MIYSLPTPLDDAHCGNCHSRPRRWGDWLCPKCRAEADRMWKEAYQLYKVATAMRTGEDEHGDIHD